jgi:hypothetical protein
MQEIQFFYLFFKKLDRARLALGRLGGNVSERETHDALTAAACKDPKAHDEICLGLLGTVLLEKETAAKVCVPTEFLDDLDLTFGR